MRFGIILGAVLAAAGATAVFAGADQREPTMKEVGGGFGPLNRMNRGQTPYNGAEAAANFEKIAAAATKFAPLFEGAPSPTQTSLPSIWENKADFDARLQKFAADAKAAAAEASKGEAEFKAAFATVQPQCGGCHEKYRGKD
jgi:cytochrome c556